MESRVTPTIVLTSAMLLVVSSTVVGQSDFSGADWLNWPQSSRVAYVVGWIDGRQAGAWEAVRAIDPDLLETWTEDERLAALESSITANQIMVGVDTFFSDYRNRQIELRTVIEIVSDEASGRREWPEEDLRGLRQRFSRVPK